MSEPRERGSPGDRQPSNERGDPRAGGRRAAGQGFTRHLIGEIRRLVVGPLPGEVVEVARQSVLDWLGGAIAGADQPLVVALREEIAAQGGNPLSTLVVHGERTSPAFAALANGAAADALDYSDAHSAMRGHTTPAVVGAALALAEARGAGGAALLRAIVAGVETECRVGLAAHPLAPGLHPTGNLAPFGAAAACALLLRLEQAQWAHALGIAATQAAGLLASGGTMAKPLHSGKAAMNGLLAAGLAARGFLSRPDAIEAPQGFLATHAREPAGPALQAAAGRYLILDTHFKRHAACMLTHASIENMLKLKNDHGAGPADVRAIELQVPPGHLAVCNIAEPLTGLEAKFSLRASAAMALLGDDTGSIAAFNDARARHPEVRALGAKVRVTTRDDLPPGGGIAVVDLGDGRRLTLSTDTYKPMDDLRAQRAQVERKFMALAAPVLGAARAGRLRDLVSALQGSASVAGLMGEARRLPAR
ncbi:MAG: MmgE/PrpD family protein [Burkholderiales bacterium]|nr:MmgE/PrpD family protein [Burkholderiales bacterium]